MRRMFYRSVRYALRTVSYFITEYFTYKKSIFSITGICRPSAGVTLITNITLIALLAIRAGLVSRTSVAQILPNTVYAVTIISLSFF